MVTHLADTLVDKYASECTGLLDPFCGSGAILMSGKNRNIPVCGLDINPYAILLSQVKLEGFNAERARAQWNTVLGEASITDRRNYIRWNAKRYWFNRRTIEKYERLRYLCCEHDLYASAEGRAILLAYALSVRRCSRADQRSPKPFISKLALKERKGKHFDPFSEITYLLDLLIKYYGDKEVCSPIFHCQDLASPTNSLDSIGRFSHIITSPPYANAQDYFRNFKLELYLLEELLPFSVETIKQRFIGTERGNLLEQVTAEDKDYHRELLPELTHMERTHPRLASIVHRYLVDMKRSFKAMKHCLLTDGVLVVVCGDNLVGGYSVPTWKILNSIVGECGFSMFDTFGDEIICRQLPPNRAGHKSLIKQEIISAFRLVGGN